MAVYVVVTPADPTTVLKIYEEALHTWRTAVIMAYLWKIVTLLALVAALVSLKPSDAASPSGTTGCSTKWAGGYCWRYCSGTSGSWCYTAKGCGGGGESCAQYSGCPGISCDGAADGCVKSC